MADRIDAEFLEILSRQVTQHLCVDRVFSEGVCVLLEVQAPQLRRYVHQAPPFPLRG
jgi:hypothetical protein